MHTDLLSGTGAKDVSPELLAFLLSPGIGALVNRDDELGDGTQDLKEFGFCGFHVYLNFPERIYSENRTEVAGLRLAWYFVKPSACIQQQLHETCSADRWEAE